jgi:hypothetical protein
MLDDGDGRSVGTALYPPQSLLCELCRDRAACYEANTTAGPASGGHWCPAPNLSACRDRRPPPSQAPRIELRQHVAFVNTDAVTLYSCGGGAGVALSVHDAAVANVTDGSVVVSTQAGGVVHRLSSCVTYGRMQSCLAAPLAYSDVFSFHEQNVTMRGVAASEVNEAVLEVVPDHRAVQSARSRDGVVIVPADVNYWKCVSGAVASPPHDRWRDAGSLGVVLHHSTVTVVLPSALVASSGLAVGSVLLAEHAAGGYLETVRRVTAEAYGGMSVETSVLWCNGTAGDARNLPTSVREAASASASRCVGGSLDQGLLMFPANDSVMWSVGNVVVGRASGGGVLGKVLSLSASPDGALVYVRLQVLADAWESPVVQRVTPVGSDAAAATVSSDGGTVMRWTEVAVAAGAVRAMALTSSTFSASIQTVSFNGEISFRDIAVRTVADVYTQVVGDGVPHTTLQQLNVTAAPPSQATLVIEVGPLRFIASVASTVALRAERPSAAAASAPPAGVPLGFSSFVHVAAAFVGFVNDGAHPAAAYHGNVTDTRSRARVVRWSWDDSRSSASAGADVTSNISLIVEASTVVQLGVLPLVSRSHFKVAHRQTAAASLSDAALLVELALLPPYWRLSRTTLANTSVVFASPVAAGVAAPLLWPASGVAPGVRPGSPDAATCTVMLHSVHVIASVSDAVWATAVATGRAAAVSVAGCPACGVLDSIVAGGVRRILAVSRGISAAARQPSRRNDDDAIVHDMQTPQTRSSAAAIASWRHASGSKETQSHLARRARGTSAPARDATAVAKGYRYNRHDTAHGTLS